MELVLSVAGVIALTLLLILFATAVAGFATLTAGFIKLTYDTFFKG